MGGARRGERGGTKRGGERRRKHEQGHEIKRIEKRLMKDTVTWNMQRMTMREHNRRRLRSVCERI